VIARFLEENLLARLPNTGAKLLIDVCMCVVSGIIPEDIKHQFSIAIATIA